MSRDRRQAYIPTLDGWRALAIALVLGAHSVAALSGSGTLAGRALAALFGHVSFGVDIFFALSGYLICTMLLNERERTGYLNLPNFYVRRVFRIFPPILVYLSTLALLGGLHILPGIQAWDLLAVVASVRNYVGESLYTGHFWSVSIEEHFYLFIALLLARAKWRTALIATLSVAMACVLVRAFEYQWLSGPSPIYFRTESRLDALMYGAAIALLLRRSDIRARVTQLLSPLTIAGLLGATAVVLSLLSSQPVRRSVIAFALPLFVIFTVLRPMSLAGRFLEVRWLRWFGRLSYSLYIWQELFLVHEGRPLGLLQQYPFNLAAAMLCAVSSYYFVERPLIRMGHRVANRQFPTIPSNEPRAAVPPGKSANSVAEPVLPADLPHIR